MEFTFVEITAIIFGLATLILVSRARKRIIDSQLKKFLSNFSVCLTFIVMFSMWQTFRNIFDFEIRFKGFTTHPEYMFLIFAYIAFVISAYRILKLSENFGHR